MAFVENGNQGEMTGTIPIEIVPSPSSGTRRIVKTMTLLVNRETAGPIQIVVRKVGASTSGTILDVMMDAGDTWLFGESGEIQVLNAGESIIAFTDVTPSHQPEFTSAWGDAS